MMQTVNGEIHSGSSPLRLEDGVFGRTADGVLIDFYKLSNQSGISIKLITHGASIVELWLPDRNGRANDVVLGFDSLNGYLGAHPFFGGTIGRFANRIAHGHFELDGQEYQLARNHGPHFLHGGRVGFDRRVWLAESLPPEQGVGVRFAYVSQDGEEHFPGKLSVTVTFTLSADNEFTVQYVGESDRATPLNLTNHSYFNLAGSGDILGHTLSLNADNYTPVDSTLIPTGEIQSVEGTPLDFRTPFPIGSRIAEMKQVGGYDHNFVLNGLGGALRQAARVYDPLSGRQMEIWSTEPAIQFYAGVQLDGSVAGKGGSAYRKYGGLCLEPQHYPDSPNHPGFPSTILRPGERFYSETIYRFSAI